MTIHVNGEPVTVAAASTVSDLVEQYGLARAACAVEVNRQLVPRAHHGTHALAGGDVVEIVTLVGGG